MLALMNSFLALELQLFFLARVFHGTAFGRCLDMVQWLQTSTQRCHVQWSINSDKKNIKTSFHVIIINKTNKSNDGA